MGAFVNEGFVNGVLVVDADDAFRAELRHLLAPELAVTEASTAKEALERARTPGLACVLISQRLPDVDGLALVPELVDRGLGVVMLSGDPSQAQVLACLRAGVHDYVAKRGLDATTLEAAMGRATQRARQAQELALHGRLVERMPFGAIVLERARDAPALRVTYRNPAGRALWALSDEREGSVPGLGDDELHQVCEEVLRTGDVHRLPPLSVGEKSPREYDGQVSRLDERRVLILLEDVTELLRTQRQLEAASRMEAVGRLAGGVAHDFNNMLTVISGHAGFIRDSTDKTNPTHEDAIAILDAASRSGELTRQLLAFSRRQIRAPRVLQLNAIVESLESLLRRIIGEDFELATQLDTGLGAMEADPSQVEQVLMNLVVNARDAMPRGGTLEIRTCQRSVRESFSPVSGFRVPVGDYVELRVADQGIGMDEETLRHIFEPFFTTKSKDEGTGLGLATVYGVVKQSGGFVWATSQLGEGATFHVLFPRVDRTPSDLPPLPPRRNSNPGGETILLVEDERLVRRAILRILRGAGYVVLEAARGLEALELAREHDGPIDLLLTDVVMPGLDGRAIADAITSIRPHSHILFMSGYSDDKIVEANVLDPGTPFVGKPFSREALLEAVGDALWTGPELHELPK